jgi:hypothetical protein
LGKAKITHPFHPLCGKSFTILKIRKFPSGRFFSLITEDDVFCVPESWIEAKETGIADDSPYNAEIIRSLLEFVRNHTASEP